MLFMRIRVFVFFYGRFGVAAPAGENYNAISDYADKKPYDKGCEKPFQAQPDYKVEYERQPHRQRAKPRAYSEEKAKEQP